MKKSAFDLLAALSVAPKGIFCPESPIEEGETLIGTVSKSSQQLYQLMREAGAKLEPFNERLRKINEEHRTFHIQCTAADHDCSAFIARADAVREEAATLIEEVGNLEKIFWSTVRLEFPGLGSIGIREGFQLVELKPEKEEEEDSSENILSLPGGITIGIMSRLW